MAVLDRWNYHGDRIVSRFSLVARPDGEWLASVSRHWNLDRADPR